MSDQCVCRSKFVGVSGRIMDRYTWLALERWVSGSVCQDNGACDC